MRGSELYELQLELECKRLLPSGRLEEFPCENPDGLALISAVRFLDGTGEAVRLRVDAGEDVAAIARRLSASELLDSPEPGASAGVSLKRHFSGRTGSFAATPDPREYVDALRRGSGWTVSIEGNVAARAFSARENARAAELSVETSPAFRRRGLARQAAAAWAAEVLSSGKVAFYSYDFTNEASAALAASLRVAFHFDAGSFDLSRT
jgi:hypothetical protein